ncbi:MAG: hypothetical protein AAGB24_09745 [Bacteroidota bacterium]
MKHFIRPVCLFCFLMLCISAKSQVQDAIDQADLYKIESPHTKFRSIHLQSHKGLPRFGTQNPYYFTSQYGGQRVDKPKNKLVQHGYVGYYSLVKMKWLAPYYDDIDRTHLTVVTRTNSDNKKDLHSRAAQQHLLGLAQNLSTNEQLEKYFCGKNDPNCRYRNQWGGSRDEFVIQEKYAAYVSENLDDLRKWSTTFFKDNTEIGYLVHRYQFHPYNRPMLQYDFENNGYWFDILPSNKNLHKYGHRYRGNGDDAFFFEFLPVSDYENEHFNKMTDPNNYYPKMLLHISPEKAEALVNRKPKHIYAAIKVKIVFKGLEEQSSIPQTIYSYHLADPIITFYEDIELTKKLGEISLKNPVYQK